MFTLINNIFVREEAGKALNTCAGIAGAGLADTGRGEGTSTEVLHRRSREVAGYPARLSLVEAAQGSTREQAGHRAVHPLLVEAVHRSRMVV